MNVLIIGNGFDLAHNLPTSYMDFMNYLDFCHAVNVNPEILKYIRHGNDANSTWENLNDKLKKLIFDWVSSGRKDELLSHNIYKLLNQRNCWYEYFADEIKNNKLSKKNWVDFESKIAIVVKCLEDIIQRKVANHYIKDNRVSILPLVASKTIVGFDKGFEYDYINCIRRDLELFIKCLDEYITIVGQIKLFEKEKLGCIDNIDVDRLVSFNYTETYSKLYKPIDSSCIDYAHGKAGEADKEDISNLVLGCEETLQGDLINTITQCGYFKKYLQRDVKATGRMYRKFYEECTSGDNVLYIFGHSLDINDGDIIKYMIDKSEKIVIYYWNIDDVVNKAQNLVRIMTKEGYENARWKIEFREQ
ncbi:MAG: hypothetical protein J6N51_02345 [Selenomonas sp.]|nr:hypothetical protein [Selenomonas sp.]